MNKKKERQKKDSGFGFVFDLALRCFSDSVLAAAEAARD